MRTRSLLGLLCSLPFAACTVSAVGPGGGGGGDDDGVTPQPGDKPGTIAASETWSGTLTVVGDVTIRTGVTVTVAPGTEIQGKDGVSFHVAGTLEAAGTDAQHLSILPAPNSQTFAGIVAESGGSVHLAYVDGT